MLKLLIKTVFLSIPLFIIAVCNYCILLGVGKLLDENITAIIVLPLIFVLFCWIFTAIIDRIAYHLSFVYWLICFIMSLITLIVGLKGGYYLQINIGHSLSSNPTPFQDILTNNPACLWHATLLMFLIPKLDGEWTTYLNTSVTVDGNRDASFKMWLSHEYTPGTVIKVGTILVLAIIAAILYYISHLLAWIPFILEGGFSLFLCVANIKNYFFR